MGWELFFASILVNLALLALFYLRFVAPRSGSSPHGPRGEDAGRLHQEVGDLMGELSRVAATHANAVEERREELQRVISAANEKIHRCSALVADLEVLSRRVRAGAAAAPDEPIMKTTAAAIRGAPAEERYAEVRRLADEGMPVTDIARRTRMGIGEVRLVLGLRDRGGIE